MASQFENFKIRKSILLFCKNLSAPLVLYFDDPEKKYVELQNILKTQALQPKLLEYMPVGPIKKVSIMSNQICAVALQDEPFKA